MQRETMMLFSKSEVQKLRNYFLRQNRFMLVKAIPISATFKDGEYTTHYKYYLIEWKNGHVKCLYQPTVVELTYAGVDASNY